MFQGIYKSAINDANKNYIFGTGSIPINIKVANLETFAKAENKQQGYQVAEVNKLISTMLTGWDANGNKPKSMSDNYLELILSCDNGFVVKKRLQFPHIIAWQNDSTPYNIADVYKEFSLDNWLKADDFENPDITLVVEPTDEILTTSTATPPEATTEQSGRFYLYYRNLPVGINRVHIDFHIKTRTEPIDFDLEVFDGLSWKDAQTILASNDQAKINVLLSGVKDVYNFTGTEGDFEDITMYEWSELYQQIISLNPNNKFTHDLFFVLYDSEIDKEFTEIDLTKIASHRGLITGNEWLAYQSDSYTHKVVPVEYVGEEFDIRANSVYAASYTFLSDYSVPNADNTEVYYATGYNTTIDIAVNTSVKVKAPNDAKYLYLRILYNNVDCTPTIQGGLAGEIDIINERVYNIESQINDINAEITKIANNESKLKAISINNLDAIFTKGNLSSSIPLRLERTINGGNWEAGNRLSYLINMRKARYISITSGDKRCTYAWLKNMRGNVTNTPVTQFCEGYNSSISFDALTTQILRVPNDCEWLCLCVNYSESQNRTPTNVTLYVEDWMPIFTFIDDDGKTEQINNIESFVNTLGLPMNVALIAENIGLTDYPTWDTIERINGKGITFCMHRDANLTQDDDDTLMNYFSETRKSMMAHGLNHYEHFMIPQGVTDERTLSVLQKNFVASYLAGSLPTHYNINVSPLVNNMELVRKDLDNSSLEFAKTIVDTSISMEGWTIFMSHMRAPIWDDTKKAQFIELVKYITDNGGIILSLPNAYELYRNRCSSIDNLVGYDGRK